MPVPRPRGNRVAPLNLPPANGAAEGDDGDPFGVPPDVLIVNPAADVGGGGGGDDGEGAPLTPPKFLGVPPSDGDYDGKPDRLPPAREPRPGTANGKRGFSGRRRSMGGRTPEQESKFAHKWKDILVVLRAFNKDRSDSARREWLRLLRQKRREEHGLPVGDGGEEEDDDEMDPSTIAAEFGMYFFEGIFDHDKHLLVQRIDKIIDEINLNCSPTHVDPHISSEMQKNGGDYRYLSRAYEWRSFFSEARNWIAHDETFEPFDDASVLDERSRAVQLAQTLLFIRDNLGPAVSGVDNIDYDIEAMRSCDETVESITSASYHLLDFESDEGITLFHLAAAAGCPHLFLSFARIGAAIRPTIHKKDPPYEFFADGAGSDAAFDTRANRKCERLIRQVYQFADAAFRETHGSDDDEADKQRPGPRVFTRTDSPKAFERALKILRGHMHSVELFTPYSSHRNMPPSKAAMDVLQLGPDGQPSPPPGTTRKHRTWLKGASSFDMSSLKNDRDLMRMQNDANLADIAGRYADHVNPDDGVRQQSRLRREFEADVLSRYRQRLCKVSDVELIFDDLVTPDMYGRTPLHCAVQYDQAQMINFMLDTESEDGLFHHIVRYPLASPFRAREAGETRTWDVVGNEYVLVEVAADDGGGVGDGGVGGVGDGSDDGDGSDGDEAKRMIPTWQIKTRRASSSRRAFELEEVIVGNLRNRYLQRLLLATTGEGETPLHFAARYDRPDAIFMILHALHDDNVVLFQSEEFAGRPVTPRQVSSPISADDAGSVLPSTLKATTLRARSPRPSHHDVDMIRKMRESTSTGAMDGVARAPKRTSELSQMSRRLTKDGEMEWLACANEDEVHAKVAPLLYKDVVSNCCPCRSIKPFSECCGRSNKDKWSQARRDTESRRTVTPIIGRAMQLAPDPLHDEKEYKSLLHHPLNIMQRIYRDMRDRNGMTALHTACKMDRDDSATVLLGLGADPGTRDIDNTCAMYHMILNIPSVAVYALDQFHLVDRSNRTESTFLSFLLPQAPKDELILRKRQYDRDMRRNENSLRKSAAGLGMLHHSKPSHRERPRWVWHPFTREEYRYKYWDYARTGNRHNKKLGDILGKHPDDPELAKLEQDWWEHSATRNRERRSLLDMVVEQNRMGCVNKLALDKIVDLYWHKFCKRDFVMSALWYATFLIAWTAVGYMHVYGMRSTEDSWVSNNVAIARLVVEVFAILSLLKYIRIEVLEFLSIAEFSKGVRELEVEDVYDDMGAMSETWPDFFYLWRLWHDIEGANAGWQAYISDTWNQFDLISYTLLFCAEVLIVISYLLADSTAWWYGIRVLLLGIIFAYLKIFKIARSSKTVGPFVIMLGGMTRDCALFLFLFVCTWVPFSLSFFVLFHDDDNPGLVSEFGTFGRALISGFRMMMVDFDYALLQEHDENTGAILWLAWMFLSALVFLNLFIAMMSNTYQLVQDDCKRVAVMQRASTVVDMLRTKSSEARRHFRLELLSSLDENGDGRERYESSYYDDPDDEAADHERNIRLEILSGVNAARNAIIKVDTHLDALEAKERKTRRVVKVLAHNVDVIAGRLDGDGGGGAGRA